MAAYRIVARYLAYAEIVIRAESSQDAKMEAVNQWPDGDWRSRYGGADLKPPDGAHMIAYEIKELTDLEEKQFDEFDE